MDYNELADKFPFLSCVKHGVNEYVGIVQNQDDFVTSIYVYDDIPTEELRTEFLRLGDMWNMGNTPSKTFTIFCIRILIFTK